MIGLHCLGGPGFSSRSVMVSALGSEISSLEFKPARVGVLSSWARHFSVMVLLSTKKVTPMCTKCTYKNAGRACDELQVFVAFHLGMNYLSKS